jgi:hypothetical protein
VVRLSNGAYSVAFDGPAAGLAGGVAIDALATAEDGDLLLSFDVAVALPGGLVADDEDLVPIEGGVFSLVFDGSAEGVATGLDLDAAHRLADDNLLLSFDTSGELGGLRFDDEDVLEWSPRPHRFQLSCDGSLLHPALSLAAATAS